MGTLAWRTAGALALIAATACSGDHMDGGPNPGAFANTAAAVSAAADQHRQDMGTASAATCPTEMARYGEQIRPMVQSMRAMSGEMDACMSAMGHTADADMTATCDAMLAAIDEHIANGCSSPDPAAEAAQHADAMRGMAAHEGDRADAMGAMMGSGMMPGGCGH